MRGTGEQGGRSCREMGHNGEERRKRDILHQGKGLHVDISHGVDLLWGNDSLKHSYLMHLADKGLGMQTCKKTRKATGRNNTICKLSRPEAWRGKGSVVCPQTLGVLPNMFCFALRSFIKSFPTLFFLLFFNSLLSRRTSTDFNNMQQTRLPLIVGKNERLPSLEPMEVMSGLPDLTHTTLACVKPLSRLKSLWCDRSRKITKITKLSREECHCQNCTGNLICST